MKTWRILLVPMLAAGMIWTAPRVLADSDATTSPVPGSSPMATSATPVTAEPGEPSSAVMAAPESGLPTDESPVAVAPGQAATMLSDSLGDPAGVVAVAAPEQANLRPQDNPPLPSDGPNVQLGQGDIPAGRAGDAMDVRIPLQNWGRQPATNIRVTPQLAVDAANFPFEITKTDYSVVLDGLAPGQAGSVVVSQLQLRGGLGTGYYRMPLTIEYDDGQHIRLVSTAMFVRVEGVPQPAPEAPPPITTQPPQTVEVAQQMVSDGGVPGYPGYPAVAEQPGNPAAAGQPVGNAPAGDSAAGATPRLMLINLGTNPGEVQAGNEFTLAFTLQNMSRRTGVENIKASLTSPEASFLPVGGASSTYIDAIGTEQTATRQLTFRALPSLEDRPYQMMLRLEYEDSSNHQQLNAEETIAVVVRQKGRAETGAMQVVPSSITVGQDANINFNLQNQGRVKLFNARVKVKEGQPVTATELFVGNVEAGMASSVDLMVHAEQATTKPVIIQIWFEDSAGVVTTVEREVSLEVTDVESKPSESPMPQQSAGGGGFGLLPLMLLALAIIAAIVIIYVVRERRKREREEELGRNLSQLDDEPLFPVDPQ